MKVQTEEMCLAGPCKRCPVREWCLGEDPPGHRMANVLKGAAIVLLSIVGTLGLGLVIALLVPNR